MAISRKKKAAIRKNRVRHKIRQIRGDRYRLSIHRTARHTHAQVIDDAEGRTLCSASTQEKEVREQLKSGSNREAAALIGKRIAEKAAKADVRSVVFDRGGHIYHGRVKALAEAARESGLEF